MKKTSIKLDIKSTFCIRYGFTTNQFYLKPFRSVNEEKFYVDDISKIETLLSENPEYDRLIIAFYETPEIISTFSIVEEKYVEVPIIDSKETIKQPIEVEVHNYIDNIEKLKTSKLIKEAYDEIKDYQSKINSTTPVEKEFNISDEYEKWKQLHNMFITGAFDDLLKKENYSPKVIIVTNPENGWDCVVDVLFNKIEAKELYDKEPNSPYVIHEKNLR